MTWDCSDAFVVEDEASGAWTGRVSVPGPLNGWTLALGFSANVDLLESAAATATGSGASWELTSKDWDAEIPDGQNLSLHFIVIKSMYHSPCKDFGDYNDKMGMIFMVRQAKAG